MTMLATVIGRGLLADRPASPAAGSLFFATDDGTLYRWSGSAWETYGVGGLDAEQVRDLIGATLVAGSGVTLTVDDPGDQVTIAASGVDAETVRDIIGAALVAGDGIGIAVDDGGDTITLSNTAAFDAEAARDAIAAALVAGSGITITVDDPGETITIAASGGGGTVDDEAIDDRVAALLQAGSNITLTYDDVAGTLTIAAAGGGGGATDLDGLSDVAIASPAQGDLLLRDATQFVNVPAVSTVNILIGATGTAMATGVKGDFAIDFAHQILAWSLLADQSGSIVVDLWRDGYGNYPPTVADTITASAKPTIAGAAKAQSSTLTGWSASGSAGDVYRVNVDSVSGIQQATLALKVRRMG